MENVLTKLRQETSKIHQELHEDPLLKSCEQGLMNKSEYIQMLKAFYSPWKRISPFIANVPIEALKTKLEHRNQAIRKDLYELNVEPSFLELTTDIQNIDEDILLGISYVLIGSSMGGTILSEKIKSSMGDVPLSYMSMTPKEAGWPELVAQLRVLDAKKHTSITIAAIETFKAIQTELTMSTINKI
ncbi:biliverdin-producing heme oxygenase [Aquimarina agarilytica]|uniref:biliverdin-producing heme oxygenase n=1 Tax=Aquimarina agarilytica TaxID=1087449 RepID=UPI000288324C|nr:biliverdin-producing heme oxygenase [Aquimarina agarilytica]